MQLQCMSYELLLDMTSGRKTGGVHDKKTVKLYY